MSKTSHLIDLPGGGIVDVRDVSAVGPIYCSGDTAGRAFNVHMRDGSVIEFKFHGGGGVKSQLQRLSEAQHELRKAMRDHHADADPILSSPGAALNPAMLTSGTPFFVFDVESIGLHGEGFAAAGGIYIDGDSVGDGFCYSCPIENAAGSTEDLQWVEENVPSLPVTCDRPGNVRDVFWREWKAAKKTYPDVLMAAECMWPVEANFLSACVGDGLRERCWDGPYPFVEIASVMAAAGKHPMATYPRKGSEEPPHHPLTDARQSARLLAESIRILEAARL